MLFPFGYTIQAAFIPPKISQFEKFVKSFGIVIIANPPNGILFLGNIT